MPSEQPGRTILAVLAVRANIALIQGWMTGRDIEALRSDTMLRYAVERAFMAMDAAVRDIPRTLIETNAIPAKLIAGFRNALAHSYDDILDDRVMLTINADLPDLDARMAQMLASLSGAGSA